ncbi:hypothetical protein SAMN05660653_02539 [Desulfonatronum thiosulfatophilum]|uniref:PA2779 family protein n=1 Tax=Desulfonatronum thiosulfatophilum TaxID=617002 RepID=A0A1G6E220_9BACT|nr:PA2779 family protein [Desulfonatronum thiosulfatophilum]SDB51400.1 hypothetical protein SAMN05660653_02539 [Desulfonatronum thiosulfatophilum]
MNWQKMVLNRQLCWTVMALFCFFSLLPPNAEAFLAQSRLSSGEVLSERATQLAVIQGALEHKIVAQRLQDYGMSKAEVVAKLDTLSEEQLHQLATLSGDVGGGVIGGVIGVLVIILLVVVILRISDRRIVIQ